jgi:hypothetical protein
MKVRATECDILVNYWHVRVPTDYRHNKAHTINENKMYSITVNYDLLIQDTCICFNASFILSCTCKQIRD